MRLGALVLSLPALLSPPVRAVDAQASTTCVRQLTHSTTTNPSEGVSSPIISRDGTVVAFYANLDLTGQNPSHAQRVYVVRTDGSALRELPVPPEDEGCSPTEALSPSISADGRYVAYDVVRCPNPSHPSQRLFSTFAAVNHALDPAGLIFPMTQPIQEGGRGISPHISADGSLLSAMSFTPAFTGAVVVSGLSGIRATLTPYDINNAGAQITGDGRWIFLRRLCGGGINNYRIRTDGTSEAEQLGGSSCTGGLEPSDDGSKGVFTDVILDTTYLGYWEAGSDFRPLVSSTEYAVRDAAISGDGRYAAYLKDPLPRGSAYTCRLYRYDLAMDQEEVLLDRSDIFCGDVSLSADGSVLAFQATGDLTDQNPDQSPEAFVASVGECSSSSTTTSSTTTTTMPLTDSDGDGVPDGTDNCSDHRNPSQDNFDLDAFGDACDLCPYTEAAERIDDYGCSCNDKTCDDALACNGIEYCSDTTARCESEPSSTECDSDQDRVPDSRDKCVLRYDPKQKDSDRDGVGDECDQCPDTSNGSQADSDGDGLGDACEPAAPPQIRRLRPTVVLPDTKLAIYGDRFGELPGTAAVYIGPQAASPVTWSAKRIDVIVPPLDPGPHNLIVTTGAGSSTPMRVTVLPSVEAQLLKKRATAWLRTIKTAVDSSTPPDSWQHLLSLGLSFRIDSYQRLYVEAMNLEGIAFTAARLARNAAKAGRADQARAYLEHVAGAHKDAVRLYSASINLANGKLEDLISLVADVRGSASLIVACVSPLVGADALGMGYRYARLIVDPAADYWFSGVEEGNRSLVKAGVLRVLLPALADRSAIYLGTHVGPALAASIRVPGAETVLINSMVHCGASVTGLVVEPFLDQVIDDILNSKMLTP